MKVAVIGAGAVGTFYGAKLQNAGHRVQYQSRSMHRLLASHAGNEVEFESIWGDFKLPLDVHESSRTMAPAELVILSTKAMPDIDVKKLLSGVVGPETYILCLQNGINQENNLAEMFPGNPVLGGLAFTCINRISPTHIHHLDYGRILMGVHTEGDGVIGKTVSEHFTQAGIECEYHENLRRLRWRKLLWNVPFNSLSVLCRGAMTDAMIQDEHSRALSLALMLEVQAVAHADGCHIPEHEITDMITRTEKMKPYKTSMLLDYEAGRALEIEAILGEPIRIGKRLGVDVPRMEAVYAILGFYQPEA